MFPRESCRVLSANHEKIHLRNGLRIPFVDHLQKTMRKIDVRSLNTNRTVAKYWETGHAGRYSGISKARWIFQFSCFSSFLAARDIIIKNELECTTCIYEGGVIFYITRIYLYPESGKVSGGQNNPAIKHSLSLFF